MNDLSDFQRRRAGQQGIDLKAMTGTPCANCSAGGSCRRAAHPGVDGTQLAGDVLHRLAVVPGARLRRGAHEDRDDPRHPLRDRGRGLPGRRAARACSLAARARPIAPLPGAPLRSAPTTSRSTSTSCAAESRSHSGRVSSGSLRGGEWETVLLALNAVRSASRTRLRPGLLVLHLHPAGPALPPRLVMARSWALGGDPGSPSTT